MNSVGAHEVPSTFSSLTLSFTSEIREFDIRNLPRGALAPSTDHRSASRGGSMDTPLACRASRSAARGAPGAGTRRAGGREMAAPGADAFSTGEARPSRAR
eukprot:3256721-Prymnesium_polylepis.1